MGYNHQHRLNQRSSFPRHRFLVLEHQGLRRVFPVATPHTVAAAPLSVATPVPAPAETVIPAAPVPPPVAPVPVETSVPAPTPEPVLPAAPAPEPVPTPAPVPEESSIAVEPQYDAEAAAQRIRQIKSLVNEKVGNPVNLVDINNEVGREYMSALLDAMKKLNSGSSVMSAMKRLEAAFVLVEATLKAQPVNPPAAVAPSIPVASPVVPPSPVFAPPAEPVAAPIAPEVLPVEPAESLVIPREPEVVPEPVAAPIPVLAVAPEPVPVPEPEVEVLPEAPVVPVPPPEVAGYAAVGAVPVAPQYAANPVPLQNVDETVPPVDVTPQPASTVVPIQKVETEPIGESAWGPAADTVETPAVPKRTSSLAESTTKPHTLDELPSAAELASSSVAGDPLFTKEVDGGLDQLLLEWPIFKKSGLFGTGPKGHLHPLFIKIAELQIPLLLAGRFEGATQEIRQSITDYMNGWRYEQGIIYQQGETFEHYLRRVIRHILDLQKNR
jgi:hypothetical protein